MHREEERLMSFTNWTVDCVDINELAMLGLYFLRPPDVVKCAFCDVELRYWMSNEEVFIKHFLGNNDCPLLTLKDNNNVAINPEELDSVLISASYCSNMTLPDYSDEPEAIGDEKTSTLEVECPVSCAYVQYETNEDRLATYDNWSSSFKKTPDELSEAGFFYSGIKDEVTCFSCGGSIAKWQEDYDIWEIHASQFSNCDYVKFVQSEEFIRNAKRKYAEWNNIPEEADLDLPSTSSNTTQNTLEITSQTQESSNRSISLDKSCKVDQNGHSEPNDVNLEPISGPSDEDVYGEEVVSVHLTADMLMSKVRLDCEVCVTIRETNSSFVTNLLEDVCALGNNYFCQRVKQVGQAQFLKTYKENACVTYIMTSFKNYPTKQNLAHFIEQNKHFLVFLEPAARYKAPIVDENCEEITHFCETAVSYFTDLQVEVYDKGRGTYKLQPISKSQVKTGFIGLRACLRNLPAINIKMREFCPEGLLMYPLLQDHLEFFFGEIRSKLGCNTNPTVVQFRSILKRLVTCVQMGQLLENTNCKAQLGVIPTRLQ
uniref:Transposable element P transposase-like RNase H C-terminal domain-containing protein n=1 Tax=Phlebotomus papatasi TaxID=29031 RepID=A0A1B0D400_PHLPP